MGICCEAIVDKGCGPACGWALRGAQLHWFQSVLSDIESAGADLQ